MPSHIKPGKPRNSSPNHSTPLKQPTPKKLHPIYPFMLGFPSPSSVSRSAVLFCKTSIHFSCRLVSTMIQSTTLSSDHCPETLERVSAFTGRCTKELNPAGIITGSCFDSGKGLQQVPKPFAFLRRGRKSRFNF